MLGGGLCTTLHDYMRFLDMIYHNGVFEEKQLLKPETIHEMQANQVGNAEVHPGEYVERALKKYITDGTEAKGQKCPNCGHESLVYQEGCLICKHCGTSRCG